jgi:hypothetical protein
MSRDSQPPRRGDSFGAKYPTGRRLLASVSLILLTLISPASVAAQGAAPPQAKVSEQIIPYLKPQLVVPIAEGRTINLVCLGHGSPTVILTAGLGGWSWVWYRIQSPLSRRTRVCAWDPAGLGFSSPSPEPQDTVHETEDLEEALKVAHLDGPYVMVTLCRGLRRHTVRRPARKDRGRNALGGPRYPRPGRGPGTGRTEVRSVRQRGADGGSPCDCASAPPSFEAAL